MPEADRQHGGGEQAADQRGGNQILDGAPPAGSPTASSVIMDVMGYRR
jgi:hypothetical protein